MPTDYSPSGSRRSSRRGGRRSRRGDRNTSARPEERAPRKKSLIEKILGFFQPAKKSQPAPARTNGTTTAPATPARNREKPAARTERPTGMRKPEVVEVTSPRLYVGNLSFDASESDLFELFNGVGLVRNVEVVMNRHTMKSKGFAFVDMQTVDEAKRAVTELHDKEYMGRKLVVSGAKAVEERRSERTRQPEQ
ncbi:MAG: RNA-binding protein [Terrimicrobiaceae bacterium]|nr:RNA-binding protein [Terrimicrobiaceae bacterium]